MTVPGELDKMPIKVVPIYIEPVVEAPPLEPEPTPEPEGPRESRPALSFVGVASFLVSLATAIVTGVGVSVASNGYYDAGTVLAWVGIALSALAVIGGVVAAVVGWGRRWALLAILVGVLSNPWVLTTVLGLVVAP